MENITSYSNFIEKSKNKEKSFLLLFKSGNEQSTCALENFTEAFKEESLVSIFIADVSIVRDIHIKYDIKTVPSLLIFEKQELISVVKGCQEANYYKAIATNAIFQAKAKAEGKEMKRVTVYSTPTCSWCNTLKAWLRKNNIPFSDVDVSRDEKASEELVRRTGQTGVPQTDINGQIVVGFDQKKLKELLEI
jgi:glutaredoxin-like YruB-family protein